MEETMFKLFGGVIIGVFVGAFVVEIIRRTRPQMLDDLERRACDAVDNVVSAFREGYAGKPEIPS